VHTQCEPPEQTPQELLAEEEIWLQKIHIKIKKKITQKEKNANTLRTRNKTHQRRTTHTPRNKIPRKINHATNHQTPME
jgi:hypothetical protein